MLTCISKGLEFQGKNAGQESLYFLSGMIHADRSTQGQ